MTNYEERQKIAMRSLNEALSRAFGMVSQGKQGRRKPLAKVYNFDPSCKWCVEGRSHSQRQHNYQVDGVY